MRNDAVMTGEAFGNEVPCGSDEIGERVHLLVALAVFIPGKTLVLAAADMRDGVDEAAIHEREPRRAEACRNGDAIGAVAIKQAGRGAVELCILVIEQGHRHQFTIRSLGEHPARDIVMRIVTGRNFLRLQKLPLARPHIVVEELFRRRHGRIGEADHIRIIFGAAVKAERIGLLVEGDGMFLAGFAITDHDARQAVIAFHPDKMMLVGGV